MTPQGLDAYVRRQAAMAVRTLSERIEREPYLVGLQITWKLGDPEIHILQWVQPPTPVDQITIEEPARGSNLSGSVVGSGDEDLPSPSGSHG